MRSRSAISVAAGGALALLLLGCGADTTTADRRQALEDYVAKVQPIRLGINELLDKADPILEGYRDGDLSAKQAHRGIERIEGGAAGYAVRIAAIQDVPAEMRAAQDSYAHTFVLQDTYLSALAAALPRRARRAAPFPERAAGGDHRLAHSAPGARRPLACDASREPAGRRPGRDLPGADRRLGHWRNPSASP
jgi:hypothetical protein